MADETTPLDSSLVVDLPVHHEAPQGPPRYECTLSPELITKAREELQEKPEWRLRDVQALRDMILKEHPNLRTRLDDAFLLRFLRARKFDYDRALQLFVNYHSGRRGWPELFDNLRPSAIKAVLDLGFVTVLPHPDPDGRRVICLRPGRWMPHNYPIIENLRALYLTLEKLIQSEETQVNGIVILADYNGVGLSQASHLGPFLAKRVVGLLQDGFPVRIKAVNIINEPRIFKGIFAIIRPFLKEKITNRFFLHGSNLNSLHKNVPRHILPQEYGGSAGVLDTALWNQTLLASEEEFVHHFSHSPVTDDELLQQHLMSESEAAEVQCEDSFRGVKSQLYYCY
ncbi:alpha-tocopherol transfer protein-like [Protopterus annectens]|uniref:alpha-tocopherol transfer protein-like n=1 Tax=Protopterus annectens TaxID=7888 RepID=UPI001CFB6EA6|nr:alpha-tocopherol transfer protein-like [Protopterus annectens]XP_043945948.1 alpha-tocopherol transfer protein-like [Protopterus annectens]XP_043945949.1 alpha-tocopherol transfer protein-like [Protopterus annectens]XP_043945950.1 alpha-tocopherol transfer protein-like [Protopterus annectens]XP_043945951.1 alpha-tocopherol transfer protein-like [Protopterus annectens]XP_043945952.1 alpha-tocopherol transfer protein-like [Protopterus annectens]XP_043945953.1 alpha-tocopherol transfer protei